MNTQYETRNAPEIIPRYGKPIYTDIQRSQNYRVQGPEFKHVNLALRGRRLAFCAIAQPIIDVFCADIIMNRMSIQRGVRHLKHSLCKLLIIVT
jgi:hypothetical protein